MVSYDFSYLIQKIKDKHFESEPFNHIYIEDFFSKEHFLLILASKEISSPIANNDKELIDGLLGKGFKPIPFPGCVTDIDKYISWHQEGRTIPHHTACGGSGMALRLYDFPSQILKDLNEFLASDDFNRAIAEKFNLAYEDCLIDGGIQKYLDGYEISPHPDTRKKAATFMVNINPTDKSEKLDHHTHYLKLKKAYSYVEEFWKGNLDIDRAWVPWEWAETVKQQSKNNSIVLFSPSDDTLHGVKASYNHLTTQRTQLYGNLWYKLSPAKKTLEWERLDLLNRPLVSKLSAKQKIGRLLPNKMKILIKKVLVDDDVGKRNI
jgi:hypothetical protein